MRWRYLSIENRMPEQKRKTKHSRSIYRPMPPSPINCRRLRQRGMEVGTGVVHVCTPNQRTVPILVRPSTKAQLGGNSASRLVSLAWNGIGRETEGQLTHGIVWNGGGAWRFCEIYVPANIEEPRNSSDKHYTIHGNCCLVLCLSRPVVVRVGHWSVLTINVQQRQQLQC